MDSSFQNKAKTKAQDIARKVAKQAVYEVEKTGKDIGSQLTGEVGTEAALPAHEPYKGVDPKTHEEIHDNERKTLTYLQDEIAALRKRNKMEEQRKSAELEAAKAEQKPTLVLQEPVTRPKRGLMPGSKQAKGTGEMVPKKVG